MSTLLSNVDDTSALDRTIALLTPAYSAVHDAAQSQAFSQHQNFIKTNTPSSHTKLKHNHALSKHLQNLEEREAKTLESKLEQSTNEWQNVCNACNSLICGLHCSRHQVTQDYQAKLNYTLQDLLQHIVNTEAVHRM